MKRIYSSLFAALLYISYNGILFAQTVVTVPVYPTDLDSCTVIYDATKGNGQLTNVPPPIYAHTGVITNQSTSSIDWKYVIAAWNVNLPKAQMIPMGNNIYHLKLLPSIRAFYGVPPGETILKLAFVFRNADGSKVGREANGDDIFSDVYPASLSVNIIQPANKSLYLYFNDPIPVKATSPLANTLRLYVNNILVKTITGTTITDTLTANNFNHNWMKQWVKILAINDTASKADSFSYTVIPVPDTASLPAGIADGINYTDSTSVILSIMAPGKNNCFVTGDFNNWGIDSAHYMYRTPDGNHFWHELDNLMPRHEYIFQYLIDDSIRVADPYSEKISDPNDQDIDPQTYPDLIPYPSDKTTQIASVLQTAQEPFIWPLPAFTPPKVTDLVIYELLIRDFTSKHTYLSIADTLDYLVRLGVNAIELMPVMEFEGNSSWGYNPDFLFAPDKYYGPANTLKQLIETAHSKGIAVIFDIVMNHQFGSSPLVRLYWDPANGQPAANNPWFNPIPKHPYNVGYDFNHESLYTRNYCKRVLQYWLQEYHIDGFRFDMSKGFTQVNSYPDNMSLWAQYDTSRITILTDYANAVHAVKPAALVILEHFADNSEELVLSSRNILLWGNMNYNYSKGEEGWTANGSSDLSWMSYKARGWADPHAVGYMESHDEERLMFNTISYGNTSQLPYNTRDTTTAIERMELCAAFFYTIPGPKMLWEFGEQGYDYSINYPCGNSNCRLDPKPPRWDYLSQWRRSYLFNIVRSLISLKKDYHVFETGNFTMNVYGPLKTITLQDSSMSVCVAGNFDVKTGSVNPQFPKTGIWYDYFSGDSLNVTDLSATITLQPGEYHLYTTVRLQKPLFTGIDDDQLPVSVYSSRAVIFPNPASEFLTIESEGKIIRSEIFSMQGKNLMTISNPDRIDISILEPGLYFLKIIYNDHSYETVKFMKRR